MGEVGPDHDECVFFVIDHLITYEQNATPLIDVSDFTLRVIMPGVMQIRVGIFP